MKAGDLHMLFAVATKSFDELAAPLVVAGHNKINASAKIRKIRRELEQWVAALTCQVRSACVLPDRHGVGSKTGSKLAASLSQPGLRSLSRPPLALARTHRQSPFSLELSIMPPGKKKIEYAACKEGIPSAQAFASAPTRPSRCQAVASFRPMPVALGSILRTPPRWSSTWIYHIVPRGNRATG